MPQEEITECCDEGDTPSSTSDSASVIRDNQPKPSKPVEYTAELGNTICDRLVDDESLRSICAEPGMPAVATVSSWISNHREFRDMYARACEFQAHCISDDAIDVADDASGDWVEKVRANGRVVNVPDRRNIPRCRLRCEVRFWVASELLACARSMSGPAKKVGWCTPPVPDFTFPAGGFPPHFTPTVT
jgi:hypothetical protein